MTSPDPSDHERLSSPEAIQRSRPGARIRPESKVSLDVLAEAKHELERLQRRSMASLLRQAAAVVAPLAINHGVLGSFPLPPLAAKPWRVRARAAIRQLSDVGTGGRPLPAGTALVGRLLGRPVERWPSVSRLAQAARRVEDSEFARICLGHALLAEGHPHRAERVFRALLRRPSVLRHRWRVLEGLALAHHANGRDVLALGAIESAAEDPNCGVAPLVEGLAFALVASVPDRACRAAARLDMLVDPYSPEFAAALGRLRARTRGMTESSHASRFVSRHPKTAILRCELARERRSAAGRVARALM